MPLIWIDYLKKDWNVILPKDVYNQFKKNKTPLIMGFHNKKINANIKIQNSVNVKTIYPVRMVKKNGQFKIGPTFGIMTTGQNDQFRGNKKNFKDIILTGIKTGVSVFVFTVESLDQHSNTVDGFFYLPKQKKWVKKRVPLPDVVYNRIPYRREEKRTIVKETIQYLKKEGTPFFNLKFFDKLTLNQWMRESDNLSKFIPESTILKQEYLEEYILKYPIIYLKPVHGKAGIGFIRIEKTKNNLLLLTYQTKGMTIVKEYKSFKNLWRYVNSTINNKEYIIQQGIQLNTFRGKPYDVRVLVQKNGFGKWKVSGVGIRVAGNGSITTHVPQGGSIQSVHTVFQESFGNEKDVWLNRINDSALEVAKHLEKKTNHPLGELSMDFGIDQRGAIWFFEANAKPMKFDEPTIRQTSLLRLMQYARYLSGFTANEVTS